MKSSSTLKSDMKHKICESEIYQTIKDSLAKNSETPEQKIAMQNFFDSCVEAHIAYLTDDKVKYFEKNKINIVKHILANSERAVIVISVRDPLNILGSAIELLASMQGRW